VVSTSSSAPLEDIAAASPEGRWWLQIYPYKDRELVKSLIRRAAARDFEALVLTVDTPVLGHRSRDHANRFSVPLRLTGASLWELLRCPAWTLGTLRHGIPRMRNLSDAGHGGGLQSLTQLMTSNLNPGASWSDLAWIRESWRGKLVLKGVLSPEGAERAVAEGLDAIVISNHGGRQLAGCASRDARQSGTLRRCRGRRGRCPACIASRRGTIPQFFAAAVAASTCSREESRGRQC
jgi:(S)-mandelate dehydrogenase